MEPVPGIRQPVLNGGDVGRGERAFQQRPRPRYDVIIFITVDPLNDATGEVSQQPIDIHTPSLES